MCVYSDRSVLSQALLSVDLLRRICIRPMHSGLGGFDVKDFSTCTDTACFPGED